MTSHLSPVSLDDLLYKYGEELTDVQHIKLRVAIQAAIEERIIGPDNFNPDQNILRKKQRSRLRDFTGSDSMVSL